MKKKELLLLTADRIVREEEMLYLHCPENIIDLIRNKKDLRKNQKYKEDLIKAIENNIKKRISASLNYNDFCHNVLNCPHLFDKCYGKHCEYFVVVEHAGDRAKEISDKYESIIKNIGQKYSINTVELLSFLKNTVNSILRQIN